MCVSVCTYVCLCVCILVRVCMFIGKCTSCVYIHIYVHTYVRTYCSCTQLQICEHIPLFDMFLVLFVCFQDLVKSMLHIDPNLRFTAAQVLTHQWVINRHSLPDNKLMVSDLSIKGAVEATFSALTKPTSSNLAPVNNSGLAQRRQKRKSSRT